MRHELTIPFSFDTGPIEAMLAKVGEDEVRKMIEQITRDGINKALSNVYGYEWYRNQKDVNWKKVIGDRIDSFIERNRQEVVDEAALLMAMRGSRKKAWREVLEELKEERGE